MESKPEAVPEPEKPESIKLRIEQIARFAGPKCKACLGKGYLMVVKREVGVGGVVSEARQEKPCGCALRRFANAVRSGKVNNLKELSDENG